LSSRLLRICVIGLIVISVAIVASTWLYRSYMPGSTASSSNTTLKAKIAIAATDQRVGDPEQGREHLLNSNYIDCGLPLRLVKSLSSEKSDGSVVSEMQTLKLPNRDGAAAELPYFNNLIVDADGQSVVTNNCLTCHAAPLFGEVVVGLGNEFLDFTDDPSREIDRLGLLLDSEAEIKVWRRFADKITAVAPYTIASTVGVNVANNLTFTLMAHRDPKSLRWSDKPLITLPDTEVLPVSVPPWWRMKKKHAMFYQGQARGDHARFMMTASLLCVNDVNEVEKTDAYAADIRAYIASLEPPRYPFAIDQNKSQRGRAVFQVHCIGCHGDPASPNGYPNLLVPLAEIGTDPSLALQAAIDYQRFSDWAAQSWFAVGTEMKPLQGYMPPPLDGVWATGPFLHNGSVPTIAALLDSSIRPQYWRYNSQRKFDQASIGWTYQRLSAGKRSELPHAENKWIYDTTLRGYGNTGHVFGDVLNSDERSDLLEYIKSLFVVVVECWDSRSQF